MLADEFIAAIEAKLKSEVVAERLTAVEMLAASSLPQARELLKVAMCDSDAEVAKAATEACAQASQTHTPGARPPLYDFAYVPGFDEKLTELASAGEPEDWSYPAGHE